MNFFLMTFAVSLLDFLGRLSNGSKHKDWVKIGYQSKHWDWVYYFLPQKTVLFFTSENSKDFSSLNSLTKKRFRKFLVNRETFYHSSTL